MVKLAVVKEQAYNPKYGYLANKRPTRQFVVMDDTPFYGLLKPFDEQVEVKETNMFQALEQLDFSKEADKSEVDLSEEISAIPDLSEDTYKGFTFEPNSAVVGLGVSEQTYENEYEKLSHLKTLVFIYADKRGLSGADIKDFVQGLTSLKNFIWVLHTDCPLIDQYLLEKAWSEENRKNVRLVGDTVLKLENSLYGGIFPKFYARRLSLDFQFKEPNVLTQVHTIRKGLTRVPIEELGIDTVSETKKSKSVSNVVKPSKGTGTKPKAIKKKKLSRRDLF